ncbi:MAG: MogA/MoaB family molybdenum cofactor biosynthesis protein [Candidatus Omnitrophota bacterium]|nr:MogA/MoaB family molybdenum cofactor biosynthesis protein [Candidatus Omnitrophota bacterium]
MRKVAVLTVSDRCSKGERVDQSGKDIIDTLKKISAEVLSYDIVPDEIDLIKNKLIFYCDSLKADFIFTTGGTGFGPRDVTPEATNAVAEKIIPGIPELIRLEGLKKTKNAMLSRGVSAIRKSSIIINLPGSPKGVRESLAAILDILPHAFDMLKGVDHKEE